jgi:hypothetical protein
MAAGGGARARVAEEVVKAFGAGPEEAAGRERKVEAP